MEKLILSIDAGTQSVRAIVFNKEGELLVKSQQFLPNYDAPKPGWAEINPEIYWDKILLAIREVITNYPELTAELGGLVLTTQRSTVINVDQDGRPLRPAILWLDQRRQENLPFLPGVWGLIFKTAGLKDTVSYLMSQAEANWIRVNEPEVWQKTYKYLFLSGYLYYKFTGEFVDSTANQVGYVPFDFKRRNWAKRQDWKWQAVPIPRAMLPALVKPGQILGYITKKAALESGLPAGLPVIAAAADKACEVLGTGAISDNIGHVSFGTATTFNVTFDRYLEPIPLIPAYPSAFPEKYNLEVQIYRGFWMVSWFIREFGEKAVLAAKKTGKTPEEVLEEAAREIPPGSQGLVLQPYWSPGLRFPGVEARGAVVGFCDAHTSAHFYRALIEGIGYGLREGMERIVKRTGKELKLIKASGGGSKSSLALEITSNIFNLPVVKPKYYEASALGAAMLATAALGIYPDVKTAVARMAKDGEKYYPSSSTVKIYDELYRQVYLNLYPKLRPLYKKIENIF